MDDKKAWELVMANGEYGIGSFAPGSKAAEEYAAALAHLRGKHAYFSRFKPGDEAVVIADSGVFGWKIVHKSPVLLVKFGEYWEALVFDYQGYAANESDCFPTREEAQAECDRRNKAGA